MQPQRFVQKFDNCSFHSCCIFYWYLVIYLLCLYVLIKYKIDIKILWFLILHRNLNCPNSNNIYRLAIVCVRLFTNDDRNITYSCWCKNAVNPRNILRSLPTGFGERRQENTVSITNTFCLLLPLTNSKFLRSLCVSKMEPNLSIVLMDLLENILHSQSNLFIIQYAWISIGFSLF